MLKKNGDDSLNEFVELKNMYRNAYGVNKCGFHTKPQHATTLDYYCLFIDEMRRLYANGQRHRSTKRSKIDRV